MNLRIALLAVLGLSADPAVADHHFVKRALQEARCLPASLTELTRNEGTLVYEARCRGAAGRVLTLVCTPARCVADDHASHDTNEEDE